MNIQSSSNRPFTAVQMFVVVISILIGLSTETHASEANDLKLVDIRYGAASIEEDELAYYQLTARFSAEQDTTFTFKQGSCILSGLMGKKYSDCWIRIAGMSKGTKLMFSGKRKVKSLNVVIKDEVISPLMNWNTYMLTGPESKIEFKIPNEGFVDLNFLWEVEKGFSPSHINIGKLHMYLRR